MYRRSVIAALLLGLAVIGCGGKKELAKLDPALNDTPVEIMSNEQNESVAPPTRDVDRNMVDMMTADKAESENLVFPVIYFGLDESSLTPRARDILSGHAQLLKANPAVSLMIEGHCDERGTIEYNLALGERRAVTVKDYLINYGIEQSRLYTISYGKERPVENGHDEASWSKNRRAVFQIIGK